MTKCPCYRSAGIFHLSFLFNQSLIPQFHISLFPSLGCKCCDFLRTLHTSTVFCPNYNKWLLARAGWEIITAKYLIYFPGTTLAAWQPWLQWKYCQNWLSLGIFVTLETVTVDIPIPYGLSVPAMLLLCFYKATKIACHFFVQFCLCWKYLQLCLINMVRLTWFNQIWPSWYVQLD